MGAELSWESRMEGSMPRVFDLEERTLRFAKSVRSFISHLPHTISNTEVSRQLLRSACSVGANYIEANEALGKKDFLYHIRISRKEAKESHYWLEIIECDPSNEGNRNSLSDEALQLMKIFGAIVRKFETTPMKPD